MTRVVGVFKYGKEVEYVFKYVKNFFAINISSINSSFFDFLIVSVDILILCCKKSKYFITHLSL